MTKTILLTAIGIFAILAMMIPFMPPASAGDTPCTNGPGGSVIVADELIVPPGANCFLRPGSSIAGDVKVESGAKFSTFLGGVTIGGNVEAEDAHTVSITCSIVTGDVDIEGTTSFSRVTGSTIGGDVKIEESGTSIIVGPSPGLGASAGCGGAGVPVPNSGGNIIGGDVELEDNTTTFPANVASNTIGGDLECEDNNFAPTLGPTGVSNIVSGDKEDQCAGL